MFLVGQLNEFSCPLHESPRCFSLMQSLHLCLPLSCIMESSNYVSFNAGSPWEIFTTKSGISDVFTGLTIKCRQREVQTSVPSAASPARQTQAVSVQKQGNHGINRNLDPPTPSVPKSTRPGEAT